ncbi:MAG: hypothetical protein H7274_02835 [Rhodoferax sp.]|nr:hypothetical protein [Rhodoferax sp.]
MPQDETPLGDEMIRRLPERKFPELKQQGPDETSEMGHTPHERDHKLASSKESAQADAESRDISQRPSLPDHPTQMPADIEDEEGRKIVPPAVTAG